MSEVKTCFGKPPFPFMKYKPFFLVVSLVAVLLSVYQLSSRGLNFGVDFKGGTKLIYKFAPTVSAEQIRQSASNLNIGDVQVIRFGTEDSAGEFMIRAKYIEGQNVALLLDTQLAKTFGQENIEKLSEEVVGPRVGADLRKKGLMSVLFTCILILAYIGFRFDFLFSPGAVVALIHDVVVSVGFFAFFGKEFNLPILAALLTIIGYSINDTIVIYDRIRENVAKFAKSTPASDIINVSVTETLRRTIVTSLTALVVVLILFFLGGGVLHDFAFCLIVGICFGTYSSIFIASPVYLVLHKFFPNHGIKVGDEETSPQAA